MSRLICHVVLLAQNDRLESLSRGFRDRRLDFGRDDFIRGMLILTAILLAGWLLSSLVTGRGRRSFNSPWRLFFTLCRAHRLRWSERWLLWRVARSQRLIDPACLFLEPERLAVENLGPTLRLRAKTVAQLRQRLFVELDAKVAAMGREPVAADRAGSPPDQRPAVEQPLTPLWQSPPSPGLDVPPWTSDPNGVAGPLSED